MMVALEFGEYAEQLHEHPPDRGGGVERLGGGGERDSGVVEFGEEVQEVGQAAGEPVDAVDQEHVVAAGAGGVQGALQVGAAGGGAGGVVGVGAGQDPPGLGLHITGEGGVLGVDGVGLVVLVGGAAQVDRDPAGSGRGA